MFAACAEPTPGRDKFSKNNTLIWKTQLERLVTTPSFFRFKHLLFIAPTQLQRAIVHFVAFPPKLRAISSANVLTCQPLCAPDLSYAHP